MYTIVDDTMINSDDLKHWRQSFRSRKRWCTRSFLLNFCQSVLQCASSVGCMSTRLHFSPHPFLVVSNIHWLLNKLCLQFVVYNTLEKNVVDISQLTDVDNQLPQRNDNFSWVTWVSEMIIHYKKKSPATGDSTSQHVYDLHGISEWKRRLSLLDPATLCPWFNENTLFVNMMMLMGLVLLFQNAIRGKWRNQNAFRCHIVMGQQHQGNGAMQCAHYLGSEEALSQFMSDLWLWMHDWFVITDFPMPKQNSINARM